MRTKWQIFCCKRPNRRLQHILTGLIVGSLYVHFFLGVKQVKVPKKLCDNLVIQDAKNCNNKIKLDHSLEFASVLKTLHLPVSSPKRCKLAETTCILQNCNEICLKTQKFGRNARVFAKFLGKS